MWAKVYALFNFLYRAISLGEAEFRELDSAIDHDKLFRRWHRIYSKAFPGREVYNIHVFACHLLHHRRLHGPTHEYSALRYENSFSVVTALYAAGTPNIGKQVLTSWYVKELAEDEHRCADDRTMR